MSPISPVAVSIAGFDPSGGAGVLADIKTFEQCGVYGMAVATANTIQDDRQVFHVDWMPADTILRQLDVLLQRFNPGHFKIGIIESSRTLQAVTEHIREFNPVAQIIWDPVLKSSSGYCFFENNAAPETLLENIFLVTPNLPEFETLLGDDDRALEYSANCHIYLKGGHSEAEKGVDHLFSNGIKTSFSAEKGGVYDKHGSGCVLSSAITAALASGHDLHGSCRLGKRYTEQFLSSHQSLLGWHKNISL